jgi:hypothetical protein
MMAWVTQGRIANRTVEHLGSSDRGIMLYRQVLEEMISRVEAGEDPLGVFRGEEHDHQLDILVETMVPPLTPTSVRAKGRVSFTTSDTGNRDDEVRLAAEVIEKQMRTGPASLSPALEDWIRMRLEYLTASQAG